MLTLTYVSQEESLVSHYLTILTKKWFLGAGSLGAPPISLIKRVRRGAGGWVAEPGGGPRVL